MRQIRKQQTAIWATLLSKLRGSHTHRPSNCKYCPCKVTGMLTKLYQSLKTNLFTTVTNSDYLQWLLRELRTEVVFLLPVMTFTS